MAQILDGKIVRDRIQNNLRTQISGLKSKPKLVIIQLGSLAESNTYIKQKIIFGEKIGATVNHVKLKEETSETDLMSEINNHNSDSSVHGIIVQMPIPNSLIKNQIVDAINSKKDVDGQTAINLKKLIENDESGHTSATTKGILTLLDHYKIETSGKNIVVVGRSTLVGKPTALALLNKNATVTITHSKTKDLKALTQKADILIAAAGKPKLITKEHVSPDQVVIDVGINTSGSDLQKPESEPQGKKLVGDVDFENVSKIVKAISPVPGGVGPMTVASLFQNLIIAYRYQT